jgi:hypothetical protein
MLRLKFLISAQTNKMTTGNFIDSRMSRQRVCEFYVLLTVRLGIIIVNDHLDAQFLFYMFISILYMFRAISCSLSGEFVSIQHLVCVILCRWPSSMQVGKELPDLHTRWSPTQNCASSWSFARKNMCRLYYEAVSNSDCRALGDNVNSEWHDGKGLEGSCSGLIELLPSGTEENHKKSW